MLLAFFSHQKLVMRRKRQRGIRSLLSSSECVVGGVVALLVAAIVLLAYIAGATLLANKHAAVAATNEFDLFAEVRADAQDTMKLAPVAVEASVDLDALVREVVADDPVKTVGRRAEWKQKIGVGRREAIGRHRNR